MATPVIQNLIKKNKEYVATYTGGELALPPAKHYAVVTCMDARIHAAEAYGITLGDAHIIRNAGGSVKDALRSIIISEQLLGTTEVLVIKHTGCGMLTFDNAAIHGVIGKNLGEDGSHIDFLPFPELEQAVKDDVEFLRTNKLIPKSIKISGWIHDLHTGAVNQIVAP